jgi:hypothetical protein
MHKLKVNNKNLYSGNYPEYRKVAHRSLSEFIFEKESMSVQGVFWTFISKDVRIQLSFSSMSKAIRTELGDIQLKVF